MGRDLRGRALGVGISQDKKGKYVARYTNNNGKRVKKVFAKLQDCRNWLADAQLKKDGLNTLSGRNFTVDLWYEYWIENIKGDTIRFNTRRNYNERYEKNIKPYIGKMFIQEVKPIHCQNILNKMAQHYSNSVIEHSRLVMHMMFDSALENEIIAKNPVTKSVKCTNGKKSKEVRALTVKEQKCFLEIVKGTSNYNQYALIL